MWLMLVLRLEWRGSSTQALPVSSLMASTVFSMPMKQCHTHPRYCSCFRTSPGCLVSCVCVAVFKLQSFYCFSTMTRIQQLKLKGKLWSLKRMEEMDYSLVAYVLAAYLVLVIDYWFHRLLLLPGLGSPRFGIYFLCLSIILVTLFAFKL